MKEDISEEIKELVITKIEASMPSHVKLSIGSYKDLTKEEAIDHIKKGDSIGKQIVHVHMAFLKAVANGKFTKEMTSLP